MSSSNKGCTLPLDVQENIINNIQRIFPNAVNKELVRAILHKEGWDLEKCLYFLHNSLSSFKKEEKPSKKNKKTTNVQEQPKAGKKEKKSKTKDQNSQPNADKQKSAKKADKEQNTKKTDKQQSTKKTDKESNTKKTDKESSTKKTDKESSTKKTDKQPNKSQKAPQKGENDSANAKKPDLFKKGPKNNQKQGEVGGDWVIIDKPTATSAPPRKAEESKISAETKQARRKRLIQNYSIIKQFGEPVNRISAYIKEGIKVMILLRGCSGCGKSTYANQLLQKEGAKYPSTHIFSSDSYFIRSDGTYVFNYERLQDAHEWNQKLVQIAALEGRSPIFIDNTNTRLWEMKEYAAIGVRFGYVVETLEPPTPWFFNEDILFRKTTHSVPRETIRRMLDRYEANLSGEDVLRSLQLAYPSHMIPPQSVMAGIDVPMSKNHKKMLTTPLNNTPEAVVKNIEVKSKIKQILAPKTPKFPLMPGAKVSGIGAQQQFFSKASFFAPSGPSIESNSKPGSTVKLPWNPPPPSGTWNSSQELVEAFSKLRELSAPTQNFGVYNRNYEYFGSNNLQGSRVQMDTPDSRVDACSSDLSNSAVTGLSGFANQSGTGISKFENQSTIGIPKNHSINPSDSEKLVSSENDEVESAVSLSNQTLVDYDSDDISESAESEADPEEMTSSSSDSEDSDDSEEEIDSKISSDYDCDYNLEYVLISNDNLVTFQKYHAEMEEVTTLEAFKAYSESPNNHSKNFDDYLKEFIETSGRGDQQDEVVSGLIDSSQACIDDSAQGLVPLSDTSSNAELPKPLSAESSTFTDDIDFQTLEKVKSGANNFATNIRVGNSDFVGASGSQFTPFNSELVSNKGTSTLDNVFEKPVINDPIDTLHMLFPTVSRDNLMEIFGTAQIDIDWAVGLLLDSGQDMISNENWKSLYNAKHEMENSLKESLDGAVGGVAQNKPLEKSAVTSSGEQDPSQTASNIPLSKEMGQSFSKFLLENQGISCSPACQASRDNSSNDSKQNSHSLGAIPKTKQYVGDWDYAIDAPKRLPGEPPKLQRSYSPRQVNKVSIATNTNYADFETLRNINNNKSVSHNDFSVLIGNPSFISSTTPNNTPTSILMLEKGTMTTDIETNQIDKLDSGVERLALMFPRVLRDNLEELFEKCQRDIDWAVGLLLDSGQEMSELYASIDTLEGSTSKAEEVNDSKDPEETEEVKDSSAKKSKRRKRVRHPKTENGAIEDLQKQFQSNFVLSEDHYTSERMKNYFQKRNPRKASVSECEETANTIDANEDDEYLSENSSEEEIVFMLDSDFILQLQSRFGGLLRPNMLAERNVVSLPLSLARQLHSYVMDAVQDHIQEENIFTDEDEEFARHLQEEENRARGAPSLLEIMDEEVALRKSQKESSNGRSVASALSKQLLLERFPKMDPSTLASILEDTNHSLHQASFVLSSAGHEQAETESNDSQPPAQEDNEEKAVLSREEAIKQAHAYGDVASQLYELRKDCLRKSQKAYRDGNHSVALYYSDMARWYMERIEKSNSMAAKAILTGYEGWTTLDLHFLQVNEALNVLDLFVDEVIRDLQTSKERRAIVYVITGRGVHSAGGRPRLKPAVQSRLLKRDLRFTEQNPGMLRVTIPRTALTSYKQAIEATA